MEFLSIAKQRFSVRSYTSQHVEPEKLEKILEAARVAPTAANLQPIRLIVAQSEQSLTKSERLLTSTALPWPSLSAQTMIRHGFVPLTKNRPATSTPLF